MDFLHWWLVSCRKCTGPTQSSPFVWFFFWVCLGALGWWNRYCKGCWSFLEIIQMVSFYFAQTPNHHAGRNSLIDYILGCPPTNPDNPWVFATEIWMNYDDLTVTVTFILVRNGNHPQRTINNLFSAIFRSENCVIQPAQIGTPHGTGP